MFDISAKCEEAAKSSSFDTFYILCRFTSPSEFARILGPIKQCMTTTESKKVRGIIQVAVKLINFQDCNQD